MRGTTIENVRQFKYLGHLLSNEKTQNFLNHQIASAYAKWSEMKDIFLDQKIHLKIRVRYLEACVRSRLLYSVQSWHLSASDLNKIEIIWNGFLRRLVKGGFKRRDVPQNRIERQVRVENNEALDWAYQITNEHLKKITNTTSIKSFCQIQNLKYIAHITRLENNALQKQFLFSNQRPGTQCRWKKMSSLLGIDESQIRSSMQRSPEFLRLLDRVLKPS